MGTYQRESRAWLGWQRCRKGVPVGQDVVCEAVECRLEGIRDPWFTTCDAQEEVGELRSEICSLSRRWSSVLIGGHRGGGRGSQVAGEPVAATY